MRYAALLLFLGVILAGTAPVRADARADFEAAIAAAKKGKHDEGIALVTKAIDSNEATGRDLAAMHYMRAALYSQTARLDAAVADYSRAIEIMPDHAAAFHDRAVVFAQQKKYKDALDDLARAQFLIPASPFPYFNRGRVYESMGERDEAIRQYRKARAFDPKMKEAQEALRRLGAR